MQQIRHIDRPVAVRCSFRNIRWRGSSRQEDNIIRSVKSCYFRCVAHAGGLDVELPEVQRLQHLYQGHYEVEERQSAQRRAILAGEEGAGPLAKYYPKKRAP